MSRVELQCLKTSNDRYATRWRNPRGSRKTLDYDVQRYKNRGPGENQSRRFDTCEQVQDGRLKKVTLQIGPLFKIVKVQRTNPVTYLLEDYRGKSIAGAFYEYELHRATHPDTYLVEKVLRRGNEVYVKWLGFDGSHNSWIHKNIVLWK